MYKTNEVQLASFTNFTCELCRSYNAHNQAPLTQTSCQDIANTQSQTSMEKDSKDWMNEFNLNLMVRGKSSRSGIKVKKKKNEESLMISLLKVKSITILLKTTLQNRNKHIHLCFYQVEGGSSGENTVQHQHQYKHQIY